MKIFSGKQKLRKFSRSILKEVFLGKEIISDGINISKK